MSLDVKDVIRIARAQFKELLPELSIDATDVRLEEIEREGENWAVTFSVPNPNFLSSDLSPAVVALSGIRSAMRQARIAKVVVVDGSEGQFLALRERAA
jgi:hypothetical protein